MDGTPITKKVFKNNINPDGFVYKLLAKANATEIGSFCNNTKAIIERLN